jgi:hypothetical protein
MPLMSMLWHIVDVPARTGDRPSATQSFAAIHDSPRNEASLQFSRSTIVYEMGLDISYSMMAGSGRFQRSRALALPIYADASRLPRFLARLVLASISSIVLTVLIGMVSFSIITASHRSLVH